MSLVAFALIARWHVWPHLSSMGPGVPRAFREMIGYGDLVTALLAVVALIALRGRLPRAIWLVWLFLAIATIDTVNAIVQSLRYDVTSYALGVNWVIVTLYVPALLVSSLMIFLLLIRPVCPVTEDGNEPMTT